MAKTLLPAAALATVVLSLATPALADAANPAPVSARFEGGHQVLELDMAALSDAAPRGAPAQATGRTDAPAATSTAPARPRPKRFAHKAGQYEDAPLAALMPN